jgi:hypothetical protein
LASSSTVTIAGEITIERTSRVALRVRGRARRLGPGAPGDNFIVQNQFLA